MTYTQGPIRVGPTPARSPPHGHLGLESPRSGAPGVWQPPHGAGGALEFCVPLLSAQNFSPKKDYALGTPP